MMTRFALTLMIVPVLLLSACDKQGGEAGTDISIKGDDGNVFAATDGKSGKVAVKLPGLSADIQLPKVNLDAGNVDIDGVKLFPGSKIGAIAVNAGKEGESDKVQMRFTAPASPDIVRDYFVKAFRDKGMAASAQGSSITGTQDDGDPFRIDLTPADGGKTAGVIALTSKD